MSRIEDGGAVEAGLALPRRMDAYYYGFDPTHVDQVDKILSAVAHAGKAFHHTEDWNDQARASGDHIGNSPVEWVQNAATEAAAEITRLRAENAGMREALDGIANTLSALRMQAEKDAGGRDGRMGAFLSNDIAHLIRIAALSKASQAEGGAG